MKTAEIIVWTLTAVLVAVILERLIAHFCRRADEDNSRLAAAVEAVREQTTILDALLAKESVPAIMKDALVDFAEAAMTKSGAHAMLRILNGGAVLSRLAEHNIQEFNAAADQLRTSDPAAYDLYRTFIFRVPIMAFLQRPETYKAMGQLSLRLSEEREPGAARDAAVMRQESILHPAMPAAA